jgi:hypothetical protein
MLMELELIEPVLFLGLGAEQLVPWQRPLHVRSRSRRLVKRQQSTAHNPLISLGTRGGLEPPTLGL